MLKEGGNQLLQACFLEPAGMPDHQFSFAVDDERRQAILQAAREVAMADSKVGAEEKQALAEVERVLGS